MAKTKISLHDIDKSRNEYKLLDSLTSLEKAGPGDVMLIALLEVTKGINYNFSQKQLLRIFEFVLKKQLRIGRLALFRNDSGWKCILRYGIKDGHRQINVENDLLYITSPVHTSRSLKAYLNPFSVVIPVLHKSKPLAYLLLGDIGTESSEADIRDHLVPFIETLTNIIAVALENKSLAREHLRQERVKQEMKLAGEVQAMLIPSKLPKNRHLEVAAIYKPNQEVGGDYYDFSEKKENEVALCIADVSGKGFSAALLMSNFQANLRAIYRQTGDLPLLVTELNRAVMESARGERFITFFMAKYNTATRTLNYINAGHHPPLLLHSGDLTLLKTGCPGLGMFETLPKIKEGIVNILPGSTLVCFTDGVVELEDQHGNEFGSERLAGILKKNEKLPVGELNLAFSEQLDLFRSSRPYMDDIALFSCRFF